MLGEWSSAHKMSFIAILRRGLKIGSRNQHFQSTLTSGREGGSKKEYSVYALDC